MVWVYDMIFLYIVNASLNKGASQTDKIRVRSVASWEVYMWLCAVDME